jgi:hypothetical protein
VVDDLNLEDFGCGERQACRSDVGIEVLHASKVVRVAVAPHLSDEACAKVIDGAFDSGRQRLDVVALAGEVVSPLLGVS